MQPYFWILLTISLPFALNAEKEEKPLQEPKASSLSNCPSEGLPGGISPTSNKSILETTLLLKNATADCKFKRANRILQYCEIQSNPLLTKDLDQIQWTEDSALRVFLVPHSHNDAGWVHTFELYYEVYTRHILDRVLDNLMSDPQLRFVWAEMAFFDLWWRGIDDLRRELVRKLVDTQQLEFVSGGWVMPDEAGVHFYPFLLQLIEGHQWLQEHLDCVPKKSLLWPQRTHDCIIKASIVASKAERVQNSLNFLYSFRNGWEIDPFGLSQSFSHLRADSGLENTVLLRMNYLMKNYLAGRKSLEFNWEQGWEEKDRGLFTHVLPYAYDTSHSCGPDMKACQEFDEGLLGQQLTDPATPSNNTFEEIAMNLLKEFRKQSMLFQTKNILVPIGGDFRWNSDYEWNQGMHYLKSVISFINSQDSLNTELQISNLDEYFTVVKEDIEAFQLPVNSFKGDLFPYADLGEDYWTGYFSSRMYHKVTERHLMAEVRAAQTLFSLMSAEISKMAQPLDQTFMLDLLSEVIESRRSLSLFQHHDAIAGTSTDDVVRHSSQRLHKAIEACQHVIQICLHILTSLGSLQSGGMELGNISTNDSLLEPVMFRRSHDSLWERKILNISEENPEVVISVFNPLAESRAELVRLNVSDPNGRVLSMGNHGMEMPSEIFPLFEYNNQTRTLVACEDKFELTFLANFPPLEILSFRIVYAERPNSKVGVKILNVEDFSPGLRFRETFDLLWNSTRPADGADFPIRISNEVYTLSFNSSGNINNVFMNGEKIPVEVTLQYYSTYSSGLYLFRPNRPVTTILTPKDPMIVLVSGEFQSYVQIYYDAVIQRVTLLSHFGLESNAIHVENLIDIRQQTNYELIMRVDTGIDFGDAFFTDSNGFQMMKRKRMPDLPLQGNYYPVATSAFIEDASVRMTLLTGQPGGATSLKSGQLEVMLDRIVNQDDSRGVGQGGKDNLPVLTKFKILFEKPTCKANGVAMPMLSLVGHHQLNQLLFPLETYIHSSPSPDSALGYKIPNAEPTACDIHFLGTIVLPRPNSDGTSHTSRANSGILLHRVGYDSRFDSTSLELTCDETSEGKFNARKMFGDLFENKMRHLSLTFTKEIEAFDGREDYMIKTMNVISILGGYSKK